MPVTPYRSGGRYPSCRVADVGGEMAGRVHPRTTPHPRSRRSGGRYPSCRVAEVGGEMAGRVHPRTTPHPRESKIRRAIPVVSRCRCWRRNGRTSPPTNYSAPAQSKIRRATIALSRCRCWRRNGRTSPQGSYSAPSRRGPGHSGVRRGLLPSSARCTRSSAGFCRRRTWTALARTSIREWQSRATTLRRRPREPGSRRETSTPNSPRSPSIWVGTSPEVPGQVPRNETSAASATREFRGYRTHGVAGTPYASFLRSPGARLRDWLGSGVRLARPNAVGSNSPGSRLEWE